MMTTNIHVAQTDEAIGACCAVMRQLRPHIPAEDFVPRIRAQMADGYRLAALADDGSIVALAGYRYGVNLAWGRFLYVDDLVTADSARSRGYGRQLMAWLIEEAREHACDELHLDSGVQRFAAHRFYLTAGFDITSHHFAMSLSE